MIKFVSLGDDMPEVSPQFPNPRAHTEFYERFKYEVDRHNKDSVNMYDERIFTTLFFVSPSPLCLQRLEGQPSMKNRVA